MINKKCIIVRIPLFVQKNYKYILKDRFGNQIREMIEYNLPYILILILTYNELILNFIIVDFFSQLYQTLKLKFYLE